MLYKSDDLTAGVAAGCSGIGVVELRTPVVLMDIEACYR